MKNYIRISLFASFALLTFCAVSPARADCLEHAFQGKAPQITNPKLLAKTAPLCYGGFSVIYSGITMGPLASYEHMTKEHLQEARGLGRNGEFHPDAQLPSGIPKASVSDFKNSPGTCFDKGHMSPNADFWTKELQAESYTLGNIVPQDSDNNEVLWEAIENSVRYTAIRDGELYVVTGPIFQGANVRRLNGKAMIPTALFKAIYIPSKNQAGVYVTKNGPGNEYSMITVAKLAEITGIDVFPALDSNVKNAVDPSQFVTPKPNRHPRKCNLY